MSRVYISRNGSKTIARVSGLLSASGVLLVSGAFLTSPILAQTELETDAQKAGYSLGANIGMNLSSQGLTGNVDVEALVSGLRDSINGELQLSEQEIMAALQGLQAALQAQAEAATQAQAQAGQKFLADNAARDGVTTTESGLQYEVLADGGDDSAASPGATDTVEVHYEGALTDGTVFDSSLGGDPAILQLDSVIPGWTEGIQLMQVGDKYRFVIPPELGYGANAVGPLPANSVLVFEVELLGVE